MTCEQFCQLRFVNNIQGWMHIFDKLKTKTWDEKIYTRDEIFNGKPFHVIGL